MTEIFLFSTIIKCPCSSTDRMQDCGSCDLGSIPSRDTFFMPNQLSRLNKVGVKTEKTLNQLGLKTISDLIFYLPYRYEKYEDSNDLENIKLNQAINFKGEIILIENKRSFKRKINITEALVSNDSGSLEIIWFNQPFIAKTLKPGDQVSLAGKITLNKGRLIMTSPVYEKIVNNKKNIHTENIVPVYSLTQGITQKQIRSFIHQALEKIKNIPEYLPQETLQRQKLLSLTEVIAKIHFPKNYQDVTAAINRLKFSELFIFQLKSYFIKQELDKKIARKIPTKLDSIKKFISSLPYILTDDQKKAAWTILKDISQARPMSRILQGDVGSGKTIVALIALLNCANNKKQSALMVPTEILAKQHFQTTLDLFKNYSFKVGLITSLSKKANFDLSGPKKGWAQKISQEADIIIGTHSLIQESIKFKQLSLIIVDEQHRFGVNQRQEIISKNIDDDDKKTTPHFLSMTATPIPRSLALTSFSGLNFSIISEKPKERQEIITKIITSEQRNEMYTFIEQEIKKDHQAFMVCPLINPSDNFGAKSVKSEYEKLKNNYFPKIEMAMLHGKMKTEEKEDVMKKFANNEIKILVATSVIEVGIDIQNATVMVIEGAERFGLAQLHQFRGRIGRSQLQSYCFLGLSEDKENILEENPSTKNIGLERLKALQEHQDGLSLAKIDLKNRGSGDFYGLEQSGSINFKYASFFDFDIIKKAEDEIQILAKNDPGLKKQPQLLKKIKSSLQKTHLE